ncbi:class I SAM-dependent methyltransferase [Bacillus sp. 1P06AnD]|uniref:class I SAM-dependent methyltransferase n=1 Tax=Bacillus sp. 1P06AnD TaxID=3132208 RepID=UPI00399F8C0F
MANWHRSAEEQWNSFSESWAKDSVAMWENGSRKKIIPLMEKWIMPGAKVADLGCGDGYGSFRLADKGFQVTGIDLSGKMIEEARRRGSLNGIQFLQGDLVQIPVETNSFDGIMAINSLEWVEVPFRALDEIKRIVKPGGYALFGILGPTAGPRKYNSFRRLYGEEVIMNTMQPWEFQRLAEENGWELKDEQMVEKRKGNCEALSGLPFDLQQALSFMWLFMFKNAE